MPAAETAKLVAELTLKDKTSAGVRSAVGNVNKLEKSFGRTTAAAGKFGSNIQKGLLIGATAAAGGFVAVVNAARDYESAFAGVRKTVDATEPELQALSDAFRQMAKEIPISASELAALGEAAGALGIEGTKNIEEFVRVTALLGVTTDLTADEAANSLGILSNVLHLTSDEYSQFASALVALGNAGASTESQIIEIAQRAGAAGELIGLSTEQVLGFSSAIASLGIESEAGGSALQKFLIQTSTFAAEAGDELEIMAKVAGTSAKQFKKVFDKDAGAALQRFLANLGELTEGDQIKVLKDLGFSDVRITRTLLGLANNTKLVADQMDVATGAFKENTALTKEAEQRFKTFDSQLKITKNVLTDIGITIGSKLLPKMTPLLQRLNEFVTQNAGKIDKFGTDLADAFGKFADAIGKVDWKPFIDGLKFSADAAKAAIDIFKGLPPDLQKLIVAGVAINKVTGGLVTAVAKDLGGIALKFAFERGSSPANPLFVSAVGGLPGAGGVPGKGGMGLAGVIPLVAVGALMVSAAEIVGPKLREVLGVPDTGLGRQIEGTPFVIGSSQAAQAHANDPDDSQKRMSAHFKTAAEAAVRNTASSERLEAITATQTTELLAKFGDSDTRTEAALTRTAAAQAAATKAANQESAFAIRDRISTESGSERSAIARASAEGAAATARVQHAAQQTAAAIRDKDLSVEVNVAAPKVSVQTFISGQNTAKTIYRTQS